jgi:hypothetical protein
MIVLISLFLVCVTFFPSHPSSSLINTQPPLQQVSFCEILHHVLTRVAPLSLGSIFQLLNCSFFFFWEKNKKERKKKRGNVKRKKKLSVCIIYMNKFANLCNYLFNESINFLSFISLFIVITIITIIEI